LSYFAYRQTDIQTNGSQNSIPTKTGGGDQYFLSSAEFSFKLRGGVSSLSAF